MSKKKVATEETEAVQVEEEVQVSFYSSFAPFSTFFHIHKNTFFFTIQIIISFQSLKCCPRSHVLHCLVLCPHFRVLSLFLQHYNAPFFDQEEKYGTVEKILGRTGSRGAVTQVRLAFVHDPNRKIIRNVIVLFSFFLTFFHYFFCFFPFFLYDYYFYNVLCSLNSGSGA